MNATALATPKAPVYISIPLESVPTVVALPYSLYVRLGEKYILLRNIGDELSLERHSQLVEKRVDSLYVLEDEWGAFVGSLETALSTLGSEVPSEQAAVSARNVLFAYWKTIEQKRSIQTQMLGDLQDIITKLSLAVRLDEGLAAKMVRRYSDPNLYFANHSVNTCVYSMALGVHIGLKRDDLQDLAFAASLANIGNIRIAPEILYKPGPPTKEEWDVLKKHPKEGETLLKLLLVPNRIHLAVGQHHENFDGSGYPRGLQGEEISQFARVIALAEAFSALISPRPWNGALTGPKAIEMMQTMKGRFDPRILNMAVSR
jgi:HD-GYP domain-containing protein (c-di-GMP phosphodiesterase class II)